MRSRRLNGELRIDAIGEAEYAGFVRAGTVLSGVRGIVERRPDFPGWEKILWVDYDSREAARERFGDLLFEADVSPVRRFITDNYCVIEPPKRAYFDIETDSRVAFSDAILGNTTLLSWALVGDDGARQTAVLEDFDEQAEAELWAALWRGMAEYDQLCAWNGDRFDFEVMKLRTEMLAKKYPKLFDSFWEHRRRLLFVDQMLCFKRHHMAAESGDEKTSMRLDDVCEALLGEGKVDFDSGKTWDAWVAGGAERQRLVEYNLQDTILLAKLEAETGYLQLQQSIGEVTWTPINSHTLKPMPWIDAYLLKMAFRRKTHLPSKKPNNGENVTGIEGAIVMAPTKLGVHEDVHVCDFKSLYPTIIRTFNLGSETKDPKGTCVAATGVRFRTDEQSMLSAFCEEMMAGRDKYKKEMKKYPPGTPEWKAVERMSKAYKIANNSGFGVTGNPYFRLYDPQITEAIIQGARLMLTATSTAAREQGMESVYGDTDSLFVVGRSQSEFEAFVKYCNEEVYPKLLEELGCRKEFQCVELAYEKQFARLIFPLGTKGSPSAKRYCNPPEAPIWMKDFSFKPLGEIQVGDEVIGWQPVRSGRRSARKTLCYAKVVAVHRHIAPIIKVTLASGNVIRCTADHLWLHPSMRGRSKNSAFVPPKVGRPLAKVVDIPKCLTLDEQKIASWLGGIFDGEGSLASTNRSQIVITQSARVNPEVCKRIETAFQTLGFDYGFHTEHKEKVDGCRRYAIRGGLQARLNFVRWCAPAKSPRIAEGLLGARFSTPDEVVAIEPDGEAEVIGLTTTTGNYIAWGYASKNCGTYRHYGGKAATEDSKPEIRGLEWMRTDTTRMARHMQREILELILRKRISAEDAAEWVQRRRALFFDNPVALEDVVLSKGISKPLDHYKVNAPHVRIAKALAEEGEDVGEGTRISYVVTDGDVSPTAVIPASEFDGTNLDRRHYWNKAIYPATMRVLAGAYPQLNWKRWLAGRPKVRVLPGQLDLGLS